MKLTLFTNDACIVHLYHFTTQSLGCHFFTHCCIYEIWKVALDVGAAYLVIFPDLLLLMFTSFHVCVTFLVPGLQFLE